MFISGPLELFQNTVRSGASPELQNPVGSRSGNQIMFNTGVQDPDLESNPAGYLDFFGFGLDLISFPFQQDSDYQNGKKSGHAKNLDME